MYFYAITTRGELGFVGQAESILDVLVDSWIDLNPEHTLVGSETPIHIYYEAE